MLAAFAVTCLLSALHASLAVEVYLSPHQAFFQDELPPDAATAALSRHLGLEQFEPLLDVSSANYEESFVSRGAEKVLLLTLDEEDADAVLPESIRRSFTLPTPEPVFSLNSVLSTYLRRARHTFHSVYDAWQFRNGHSLEEFFNTAQHPAFAAIELSNLKVLREKFGRTSEQYNKAVTPIRDLLELASEDFSDWRVAALTFDSQAADTLFRRTPSPQQTPLPPTRPPPQEPIGSVSTCFTTLDACNDGTKSCSSRGQCVGASKAGKTCFVCTCNATRTGEGKGVKTDYWVGQSCERKDVSSQFVLLSGTVIVILLLIFGSISLLYAVGNIDLPSTLLSTAVISKKD